MIRNYIRIAWRNLYKNRTFSIINIAGLSISVAFCLLLFFYIRHEQSYDNFSPKKDRLFRLELTDVYGSSTNTKPAKGLFSFLTKDDDVKNSIILPLIVGRDMQQTFPEVKSITRWADLQGQLVKVGNTVFKDDHLVYADVSFFENFGFKIKSGDGKTAMSSPSNVILSETAANRYFGKTDVIGKTITVFSDSNRLYTVAAVAEDAPSNSSIHFSIVLPLIGSPGYDDDIRERFNHSSHLTVVELAEGVQVDHFLEKLNKWVKGYYTDPFVAEYGKYFKDVDFSQFRCYLRPLQKCHYNISTPWQHYTNAKNTYQLACLVVIILLIAALNYVLLIISNAATRSQEVGVRKVLGAGRKAIIAQFWVETQIVVVIAVLIGLGLSRVFLPLFNHMLDTQLVIGDFSLKEVIGALILMSVALGLLAGYYPALFISKMKPVSIIKSFRTFKINPRFSNVMVGLQFTACIVLMLSAFIVNRQMRFINDKDLGFNKEQILMVKNPSWDGEFTRRVHERLQNFARTQPSILQFSGMNGGLNGSYNTNGFRLNGVQRWRMEISVDFNYFEMLGLKFVDGRPFSPGFPTDTSTEKRAIVVNETLFKMMGDSIKLGEYCQPLSGVVIGVVKDYHFETLSKKIEPLEHRLSSRWMGFFMFKMRAGQTREAMAAVEKEWKAATGNYPFDYHFLDQTITKMYEADQRWQKIIQSACLFAILIACMGLFGLSAINAINRTKEIGIRKVLGASGKDIFVSLSKGFFTIVGVSILIASPLAWWIMNKWLEDFAYRIEIHWWMFTLVGVLSLLIALAAVSYQVVKASLANPVDSLRAE